MKVVVAIDSFKGSLSSIKAAEAISEGVRAAFSNAEVEMVAMADGGEGTLDALRASVDAESVRIKATGPLGEEKECEYLLLSDGTAVVEMAEAAGLPYVPHEKRNPLYTTTYGVGEIIADAYRRGAKRFIVGIGGSATNDGGVGMLSALGFAFRNAEGRDIKMGAIGLKDLSKIDPSGVIPGLLDCSFTVACDVKNPLTGERGCSNVFGRQKGADAEMIKEMDSWLQHYADLTRRIYPNADCNAEGAGAAGGLGYALLFYLGGAMRAGIELVSELTGLEEKIALADVVITGEGRLDEQSSMGKTPVGVANLAKKHGKTVVALAGCVSDTAQRCNECGIDAFFPIVKGPCQLSEAMNEETAYKNLKDTAEQVFRLIGAARK